MLEISREVIKDLKCYQCNGYLSTSPVMLKENGDNLCGKCYDENPSVPGTRNRVYEKLAAFVEFPCCYQQYGCKEELLFQENKKHEDQCDYRPYKCPMNDPEKCPWTGNPYVLKQHYEEQHKELIANHPYNFQMDLKNNYEKWVLFEAFNYLFLVQIKCMAVIAKMWFCVRFIGKPEHAGLFDFVIKISDKHESVKKKKDVMKYYEELLLSESVATEIDINSLLKLINNVSNIFCFVSVKLKNLQCLKCEKNNITIPLCVNGYHCHNCSEIFCKNRKEGCFYIDKIANVVKHELWLCNFSPKPKEYKEVYYTRDVMKCIHFEDLTPSFRERCQKLWEHKGTSKFLYTIKKCSNKMSNYDCINITLMNTQNRKDMTAHGYSFLLYFEYKTDKSLLHCNIISNMSKTETSKFEIIVQIINSSKGYVLEKKINRNVSEEWDWSEEIIVDYNKILNVVPHPPGNDKCKIGIIINKVN